MPRLGCSVFLPGGKERCLAGGLAGCPKEVTSGSGQLRSLWFSSLGLRSSLWQEPRWYNLDRIPSCWPILLYCAFFGLQRWLELSRSKQQSFGAKSSNFCLRLISLTTVEHSRGLCSLTEEPQDQGLGLLLHATYTLLAPS